MCVLKILAEGRKTNGLLLSCCCCLREKMSATLCVVAEVNSELDRREQPEFVVQYNASQIQDVSKNVLCCFLWFTCADEFLFWLMRVPHFSTTAAGDLFYSSPASTSEVSV